MESTKLTLSVKSASLPAIKRYAKAQHTSVSKLVQDFFDKIVEKEEEVDPFLEKLKSIELSDNIKALSGILKGKYPDDVNIWDVKYEYLKKKNEL